MTSMFLEKENPPRHLQEKANMSKNNSGKSLKSLFSNSKFLSDTDVRMNLIIEFFKILHPNLTNLDFSKL